MKTVNRTFRLKTMTGAVMVALAPVASALPPGLVLPPGVLPVLQGVASGQASVVAAPNLLTVNQASQRAILDWASFNVAAGARVNFVQPNAGASALNRIHDADPSVIQGSITANGQVYLINQNGILFDQGSQVNVGSLLAATLNMPEDVFLAGLTASRTGPALEGFGSGGPAGVDLLGNIRVGANGSVLVFAPRITNRGSISAPDGQVILAAGERVWLAASSSDDLSLRGLLVEFQAGTGPVNLNSTITNQGIISADRGNVTLAGLAVNQQNRVSASTAVLQNGSVWLTSREKDTGRRGIINLATGSFTGTPLDQSDTTTLAEDQDYSPYRGVVRMEAKTVVVGGRVEAPGGAIDINVQDPDLLGGSRVFVDSGGVISAAGSWADLPMSKNLITVQLTSNELKDAPVQKGGPLQGQKVTLDIRQGTPLFDASGFTGAVKRSVAEKAATGGTITIQADGDVIVRPDAVIDVSGGGYRFQPGIISTSKFLSNGKVYDIGQATSDLRYESILNVYNFKQPNSDPVSFGQFGAATARFEQADVQGKAGGALTIIAAGGTVLEGRLSGGTTAGRYQLDAGKQPAPATLMLGAKGQLGIGSLGQSEVRFARDSHLLAADFGYADPLPSTLRGVSTLPLSFFRTGSVGPLGEYRQAGFGRVEFYADDRITLPREAAIELPAGGSITFVAGHVDIESNITAPAGTIDIRGTATVSTLGLPSVVMGEGAQLDVRGAWINDSGLAPKGAFTSATGSSALPRLIGGGTVSISSGDIDLGAGSVIAVDGGGRLLRANSVQGGKGGRISVRTGLGKDDEAFLGTIRLAAKFSGDGLAGGGSLDIHAAKVRLSNAPGADPAELAIDPAMFADSGFASYSVVGVEGFSLPSGSTVRAFARTLQLDQRLALTAPTGADLATFSATRVLPEVLRTPVNLAFGASGSAGGRLLMEEGSLVAVDPRGQVSLSASAGLTVFGQIRAPAGVINLGLKPAQGGVVSAEPLLVGSTARLFAAGYALTSVDAQGRLLGDILPGGQVNLSATRSPLVTEAGSLIDVSGLSSALDVRTLSAGIPGYSRQTINSAAGSVSVLATERVVLDGDLRGHAAGSAVGGSFALDLLRNGDVPSETARRLIITQQPLTDREVVPGSVDGYVAADLLAAGGFDGVRLRSQDKVEFRSPLVLEAPRQLTLDAPALGANGAGTIRLASSHVTLKVSPDDPLLTPLTPRATVPTVAGDAALVVEAGRAGGAGLLDIIGDVTLNGFASARLTAQRDIRLSGSLLNLVPDTQNLPDTVRGSLTTVADLTLEAGQIYPTTFTTFSFRVQSVAAGSTDYVDVPGGALRILGNGAPQGVVLSAGGSLSFNAESIVSTGVVKAPLGTVTFNATQSVRLEAGSVVSVSGNGAIVPYGTTQVGQDWFYAGIAVTGPPSKRISLSGRDIVVADGAVLDVRGGGEIQAAEFIPGPGGSVDTLSAPGTYAILPWLGANGSALDTAILGQSPFVLGTDRSPYDSVYLSGVPGLPAGTYALLPGRYALLPGAYVLRPQSGPSATGVVPGQRSSLADGTPVTSGYWAVGSTGQREGIWRGFAVETPAAARRRSEYALSDSQFFVAKAAAADGAAPPVPLDAGRIVIEAGASLALDGIVLAAQQGAGRVGELDISAAQLAVVGRNGVAPAGYLALDARRLSAFGARLLLGGAHDDQTGEIRITATAVEVSNDSLDPLVAPEITLAATGSVMIRSDSVVQAAGSITGAVEPLRLSGNSAVLRMSAGAQSPLIRTNVDLGGRGGNLTIEEGARVVAARSLLLDATGDVNLTGGFELGRNGALSVGSRLISLGETSGAGTGGLSLSNTQLNALPDLDQLVLRSYGSFDLYGRSELGAPAGVLVAGAAASGPVFKEIVLDAPVLTSVSVAGHADATIIGVSVALQNSSGNTAPAPLAGAGTLRTQATQLTLGAGSKALSGFSSVTFDVTGDFAGAGAGSLTQVGDLTVNAGRVVGLPKSEQTLSIGNTLAFNATPILASATFESAPIGGSWKISAATILQGARFHMPAGSVTMTAAQGDVVLQSGGEILAGAVAHDFSRTPSTPALAYAPGGRVELVSVNGAVRAEAGSLIDLSGTSAGGNAGSLVISALGTNGTAQFAGVLKGSAAPGARGASVAVDVTSLPSASPLMGALNDGFGESVDVRVRQGDLTVGAGDALASRHIRLSTDRGTLRVQGTLEAASTMSGNRIDLFAGKDLILENGSRLDARGLGGIATGAARDGGTVNLAARDGALTFASGATIDVSTSGAGRGGSVIFTAPRTGTSVATDLQGTIDGTPGAGNLPASVVVVGNAVYQRSAVDASVVAADPSNPIWNDYQQFMGGVDSGAVLSRLVLHGTDASRTAVRAGVELQSSADMIVSNAWDLTAAGWEARGQPGMLTLRAAGTLAIRAAVGMPNDLLVSGETWSLRLVGGADLLAADPRAVLAPLATSGSGDVLLSTANSAIRTGTGFIDIAAAHNVALGNKSAVVYTAGQPGFGGGGNNQFPVNGGDITVSAGWDVVGKGDPAFVNDWLLRTNNRSGLPGQGWWPNLASVRQAFATLGGGDLHVSAGHDVSQVYALAPTSGRIDRSGSLPVLDVQGGGDITVRAGRDIVGGQYLLGLGRGTMDARGAIGSGTPTAIYEMGLGSSTTAPNGSGSVPVAGAKSGAQFALSAAGSVSVSNISNPTIMALSAQNRTPRTVAHFFTYAADTGVTIASIAGDITVGNTAPSRSSLVAAGRQVTTATSEIAPPRLEYVAFSGSIKTDSAVPVEGLVRTYPSDRGSVRMLATQDILALDYEITDVEPDTLPQWYRPTIVQGENVPNSGQIAFGAIVPRRLVTPSDDPDLSFEFVAGRDIVDTSLFVPRAARVAAGRDLINLAADLQNLSPQDTSTVRAGRDIRYQDLYRSGVSGASGFIRIGGPGRLMVQSGRDLNLGVTPGIQAVGSNANLALRTGKSADITVVVGASGEYTQDEVNTFFAALANVATAQESGRADLRDAALAQAEQAADSLFGKGQPADRGNLTMYFSTIRTEGGSGIDIVVPRGTPGSSVAGNINAGLPSASSGNIGVVTVLGGGIRTYVENDFNVNQSKVATLQGGDIFIFSRDGNIDAGRGARDSRTTQPPQRVPITVKDPVTGKDWKPACSLTCHRWTPAEAASGRSPRIPTAQGR